MWTRIFYKSAPKEKVCHFKISWNGTRSSFLSWSVLNCTFLALHCTPAFNLRRDATMTYLWKDAAGDIDEWMWKRIDWSETIKISVPIIQKNWSEYVPMQKKNPSQTIIYFLRISLPLDLRTNSTWRFFKDIFFCISFLKYSCKPFQGVRVRAVDCLLGR